MAISYTAQATTSNEGPATLEWQRDSQASVMIPWLLCCSKEAMLLPGAQGLSKGSDRSALFWLSTSNSYEWVSA